MDDFIIRISIYVTNFKMDGTKSNQLLIAYG